MVSRCSTAICFVLLNLVLTFLPGTALSTDVHYQISITNPESSTAAVHMTISDPEGDTFVLYGNPNYINIQEFHVYDGEGTPLDYTSGTQLRNVSCKDVDVIEVEYTIKIEPSEDPASPFYQKYRGYISPEFCCFWARDIILFPRNFEPLTSITMSFNCPQDWSILTTWDEQEGVYDVLGATAANPFNVFEFAIFAMGNFDIRQKTINGSLCTVAHYPAWNENFIQENAENVFKIFEYQTSVWKTSAGEPSLNIFVPVAPDGLMLGASFSEFGFVYTAIWPEPNNVIQWRDFSSEQTEIRWTGFDWGFADNNMGWIKQGMAAFYSKKSVVKPRIYSYDWPEADLVNPRETYLAKYVDISIVADAMHANGDLVLSKGLLVNCLLAREIYYCSGKTLSIDDFAAYLSNKYWMTGIRLNEESLKAELNAFTGCDFQDFFDDYVYGTALLPVDWNLEDADGDGVKNLTEIFWDSDPDDPDTDDDGILDKDEMLGTTFPGEADSDGDGIQDGTELGLTVSDVGPATDLAVFQPDLDPSTTSDPMNPDMDNDGLLDGQEDFNHNGKEELDLGETPVDSKPCDINMDDSVNIGDALLALQVSAGLLPQVRLDMGADADGDHRLGLGEALGAMESVAEVP